MIAQTLSFPLGLTVVAALSSLPPIAADEGVPVIEVEIQSRFTGSSKLGADGGRVSQWSNLMDFSVPVAGSKRFGLGLELIVEHLDSRFRDFEQFIFGRSTPLAAAEVVTFQPTAMITPTTQWSFVVSGAVQYAVGEGARFGDSTLLSGSVGALFQNTANRKIGLGFQVSERMRASALILPFPLIDWRISDRWSFRALDGRSGRLSYRMTAAFSIIGQLEFQSQDLRLKSSASIPSGIIRYEAFPLSVGIEYRPTKHLLVSADCGVAIAQKYRFQDEQGSPLRTSDAHSPWIGTLDIDYGF